MTEINLTSGTTWTIPQSSDTSEAKVEIKPGYPIFSCGTDEPSLATIYFSHFQRLQTVVDAARSGNTRLIQFALAELDKWGSRDETDEKPA